MTARLEAMGTADDLRELAASRGAELLVHSCALVNGTRVVDCEATISVDQLTRLRAALEFGPFGVTKAAGPPFDQSPCLDRADATTMLALVSALSWIPNSHYRYILIVVPASGGEACVETEHGYG